jgi:hypothetical protein
MDSNFSLSILEVSHFIYIAVISVEVRQLHFFAALKQRNKRQSIEVLTFTVRLLIHDILC